MNARSPRTKKIPEAVSVVERQKPGPKPFEPTQEMRDSVELMVAAGILQDDIVGALRISDVTLRKYFADEIAYGHTRINQLVLRKHVELIEKGDPQSIKWWEQARMGWSDKTVVVDERPPTTRVVIELVGSPASEQKTINQTGAAVRPDNNSSVRDLIEFVGKKSS